MIFANDLPEFHTKFNKPTAQFIAYCIEITPKAMVDVFVWAIIVADTTNTHIYVIIF
jgi:hypothetical protein